MIDYKKIEIVCFDVDGVLTDGIYNVSDTGSISKNFDTRDFHSIGILLKNDYKVVIVTGSYDMVINKKIESICSENDLWASKLVERNLIIIQGVKCKEKVVSLYLQEVLSSWDHVAYMGDSENDIICMKLANISACPFDAEEEIKSEASYISDYNGGRGAVNDFCKYILSKRGT